MSKEDGTIKQNEIQGAVAILDSLQGKDISKLNNSEFNSLVNAVCLLLGICDVDGIIK